MKRRLRVAGVTLLSGALSLLLVETAFRIHAHFAPWPVWISEDHYPANPRGYFRPCPGHPDQFCPNLDRSAHACDAPLEPEKPQVLFVGDSFTWGQGVNAEDTFPARIEFPGYQRRNCGVGAYDVHDVHRKFSEQRKGYRPALTVYALVLNDFGLAPDKDAWNEFSQLNGPSNIEDYMNFRTMNLDRYLAGRGHTWAARLFLETATGSWFFRRSVMRRVSASTLQAYRNAFNVPQAWQSGMDQIRAMAAESDHFLLVIFPLFVKLDRYPLADVHQKITDEMRRSRIEALDLLDVYRGMDAGGLVVYETDSHPNEIAHAIAARAIRARLAELGWPPFAVPEMRPGAIPLGRGSGACYEKHIMRDLPVAGYALAAALALAGGCDSTTAATPPAPASGAVQPALAGKVLPPPSGIHLAGRIDAADPTAASQLKGVYHLEDGKWRWTDRAFTAHLGAPRLVFRMRFTLPAVAMAKMKTVTLSVKLNGTPLSPQTYDAAGDYVYTRTVDTAAFNGPVDVQCALDKDFKPGGADTRTLGLILRSIGFDAE